MKVLFFTNIPSPYRVDFFNELGKHCELTVCFERRRSSDRDQRWVGANAANYHEEYLDLKPYGPSGSRGDGIKQYIKSHEFDVLIFSGYSSPSGISAILHCQRRKIRYFIEYDGGFNKKDRFLKRVLKKRLITGAYGHFITCQELKDYLKSFGVTEEKMYLYPFSSLKQQDILDKVPTNEEKRAIKRELGIAEDLMILSVGQFIHRKGFDVLLEAAQRVDERIGIYIVGGVPTDEYRELKSRLGVGNVHFIDFMSKPELRKWYLAADLFAFPTREDIWGLVVNEAMACGLPIVSTDRCIAALELVKNGENGYIVPVDDPEKMAESLNKVINDSYLRSEMAECSLKTISDYSIENMARKHIDYLIACEQKSCGANREKI